MKTENRIMVEKRNGNLVPLDFTKIQEKTESAVKDLYNVSSSELELDSNLQIVSGMKTSEVQRTLIRTAVDKIDVDAPDWTFVASRLELNDLYHNVGRTIGEERGAEYCNFKTYLEYGMNNENINRSFVNKYTEEDLIHFNDIIQVSYKERDRQFTYLGLKTFMDRYLLKDKNGYTFELPQQLFMSVAMFLAQNEENKRKWTLKFYEMLSKFEVMAATPTLSNSRTNRNQLSSCFAGVTPDNIEGIFKTYGDMALLSKFGGGIGWDWNKIRGSASEIDNNKGVGGGNIPFLKITNDIAIAVDQLGTRKGAIAVYIEPWHWDVSDFIDLKKNSGEERRRAHDLFPAMWVPDLFMERANNDEEWTLFDPFELGILHDLHGEEFNKAYIEAEKRTDIRKKTVSAKSLWKKMLVSYFEIGSPFLTFKDSANNRNQNSHDGRINSSNLCTEIFQNTKAAEYGIQLEFNNNEKLVLEEEEIVTYKISETETETKSAKKLTNIDILVYNNKEYKIEFVSKVVIEDAEVLVCNLASVNLSKIHTPDDLKRVIPIAIRMLDNVIELNFYPIKEAKDTNYKTRAIALGVMGEAQMIAEQGITWGTQEHFEKIDEVMEYFSYHVINASADLAKEKGSYPTFEGSNWSKGILPIDTANKNAIEITGYVPNEKELWGPLREKIKKNGIRNGYLMAIAPTSTISILTGTTQAIEPVYKRKWFEENISGLIPVTAPNLNAGNWEHYVPSFDIDQLQLIKAGAVRQKWLDQGQSLNVFMRLDKSSGKYLNDIYMSAWKFGLKSTYYLRSQSPEATQEADVDDRGPECIGCQ